MTNREQEFAALGVEYAEGIDRASVVRVPATGREIHQTANGKWSAQPWNDNYCREFDDLLDALRFATPPDHGGAAIPSKFAEEHASAIG